MSDKTTKVQITLEELMLLKEHAAYAQRKELSLEELAAKRLAVDKIRPTWDDECQRIARRKGQVEHILRNLEAYEPGNRPRIAEMKAELVLLKEDKAALDKAQAEAEARCAPHNIQLDALPEHLMCLADEVKESISNLLVRHDGGWSISQDHFDWVTAETAPMSGYTAAAIVRREQDFEGLPTSSDGIGYLPDGTPYSRHVSGSLEVTLVRQGDDRHWLLTARDNHDPSYLSRPSGGLGEPIIPRSHLKHSLATLKPWERSPISPPRQNSVYDIFKGLPLGHLRGLSMFGPSGCGKTLGASVLVKDIATLRLAEAQSENGTKTEHELCIWRIRADDWMEAMYRWKHRDWDDKSTREPAVAIASIRDACNRTGFRPVVWVEEIDKLIPTAKQLPIINSLIDTNYELEGLIIVTGNGTLDSLRKTLGDATLRRITGENDDPELFCVLDFNKLVSPR